MKKLLPLVLIVCGLIVGSVLVGGFLQKQQSEQSSSRPLQQNSSNGTTSSPQKTNQTYTTNDVSAHSSSKDCWLIIQDKVYDVTDFLSSHPGGAQEILPYCGKEASRAFATQGGRGGHSSTAESMLNDYFIGSLR